MTEQKLTKEKRNEKERSFPGMEDAYRVLKQYFGYGSFRPGQEELIGGILDGRDVFGIMPTGSGKSLCFQIPALLMGGITLVISPLISLMTDQVAALNQAGIHAAYLNSSLTAVQYERALNLARAGRYPIIYAAPERLATKEFLDFALHAEISMVAVDEAHCVSQWGQDFRPSYLKIPEFIGKLKRRPVVSAFTATATKEVRQDITRILNLQEPVMVTTGYDRPEIYMSVETPKNRYDALVKFADARPDQCGIVYCLTRKQVEEVCDKLRADGFSATRYHAGLSDAERKRNQDDFIYDRSLIMVATNAFGMGIDKSNVRYVVHYSMPKSIEAYYQEIGRCSRDGEPGECVLFYSGQDVITNQLFIDNNQENLELDAETRALVQERDRERLKKMTFYCFTNECLRDYILRYFGEYHGNYCGNCKNCMTQFSTVDVTEPARTMCRCVEACRGRYGTTVLLDTLRGADTAKIRQYHMKENPCYGALSKIPVYRLRQILNHLLLKEYLWTTPDDYALVKLGEKGKTLLIEGDTAAEPVEMKLAVVPERTAKAGNGDAEKAGTSAGGKGRKRKKTAGGIVLEEQDEILFEKLRELRMDLAKQEKVPPYIVFSDKTLVHMCAVKPGTREEMLSVTGVGEFKYDKYGKQFLECITQGIVG